MTTATVMKSQGTELFYASGPSTATKIAQIDNAPDPLGGDHTEIDITTLDSTEIETAAGLTNPTDKQCELLWNSLDTGHQALLTLKTAGTVTPWALGLSDGTVTPTVTSSAFVTTAVARSFVYFNAFVKNVAIKADKNNVLRATVTLRVSGSSTHVPHS